MRGKLMLRSLALVVLAVLLASLCSPAHAQNYLFSVPELNMQVYVQPDASARIVYDITFENLGSPIDVVDIGMPHRGYSIGTMRASINGVALTDIRKSEYIDVGVEVHLKDQAIPPGQRGTLRFEFTMPDMVYQDTTNRDYASLQVTPTWFDASAVRGTSKIQIAVHMLEGIEPDEVLYQRTPFTDKAIFDGRTVAIWQWLDGSATREYLVGVSFPQRGMQNVVRMTLIDLTVKWLEDNPGIRFALGALAALMLAVLFFRFSGDTGCTVFVFLLGGLVLLLVLSPISVLLVIPALIPLIILNEKALRKRKKTYLPPIAQVESGGIKRGLTAPEAAVLLEMPLSKVLMLVMFGLLEKGIVRQVKDAPLQINVEDAFQTRIDTEHRRSSRLRSKLRRKLAQDRGTIVHAYEDAFLDQLERFPNKPVSEIDFTKAVEGLIKHTADKMAGFNLNETQEYYRRVIDRAVQQADALGEIEQREQYVDKYLPWIMMNDNYPTVFTHRGHQYWPIWIRRTGAIPSVAPTSSGGGRGLASPAPTSSRPSPGGRTTIGDVTGSFAGWAENTMGGLAAAILPGSLNLPAAKGGFVDLSGVDKVTNDVFRALEKSSSSSGGRSRGGGRGGGCACACAGCACACACAGGGR